MSTRTNIVLDDELIAKAMLRANVATKKAAVEAALIEFVREPDWAGLGLLRGSGAIDDAYEPLALRDTTDIKYPSYKPASAIEVREAAPRAGLRIKKAATAKAKT